MNFNYKTIPACTPQNLADRARRRPGLRRRRRPARRFDGQRSGIRSDSTAFGEDTQRGYDQIGVLRLGRLRHHPARADRQRRDALVPVQGVRSRLAVRDRRRLPERAERPVRRRASSTSTPHNDKVTYSGFKSRANMTWHIDRRRDGLLHLLGRLPAGRLQPLGQRRGPRPERRWRSSKSRTATRPDSLINYEIGMKSEFFDHRLQVNLSAYHMQWKTCSCCSSTRPIWQHHLRHQRSRLLDQGRRGRSSSRRLTDGLTLHGSGTYNDARRSPRRA